MSGVTGGVGGFPSAGLGKLRYHETQTHTSQNQPLGWQAGNRTDGKQHVLTRVQIVALSWANDRRAGRVTTSSS